MLYIGKEYKNIEEINRKSDLDLISKYLQKCENTIMTEDDYKYFKLIDDDDYYYIRTYRCEFEENGNKYGMTFGICYKTTDDCLHRKDTIIYYGGKTNRSKVLSYACMSDPYYN